MSKIKSSNYAEFTQDELEYSGVVYCSTFSKSTQHKPHSNPSDDQYNSRSKSKKKDYSNERKLKRGE